MSGRQNRPGGGRQYQNYPLSSAAALLIIALLAAACKSNPGTPNNSSRPQTGNPVPAAQPESGGTGTVEEIRSLTETGSPASLQASLQLINGRELGNTEFGRIMNAVNVTLIRTLYPELGIRLPLPDPPQTHTYARILRNVAGGVYSRPPSNSRDYLEWVLPFLALYNETQADRFIPALPDLIMAQELNPRSILAPLFLGIAYERGNQGRDAEAAYNAALNLSDECYPAAMGLARLMENQGRTQEAARFLSDLAVRFPDNSQIKRQLALLYYNSGDWSRAEPAIAEILQRDSRDRDFLLMRAHTLIEQAQWQQAQAALELYAAINQNNRFYLFLRARLQAEGYRNRDAALNYLRSLVRAQGNPIDDDASVYAARLLTESPRTEDQNEGRELLRRLLAAPAPSLAVLSLALQDCIRREAWAEARPYMTRLLSERRSPEDLANAYTVEHGLGNNAAALSYARELYEGDRSGEDAIYIYAGALIDTGRPQEALRFIEERLAALPSGVQKSRYYYLRSRIRNNDDLMLSDLRSSLFEDPRNLNALIATFDYYNQRKDERRAVYYLRQALAIAPDNPQLRRYEIEYADLLD